MPIHLVTGTPGAGKTLYTLSQLVPSLSADLVGEGGQVTKRRLLVGGVRDLLLDHEPIDVPRIRDWDAYARESHAWRELQRAPGTPPLDVPRRADNWHLWCIPGDLIVIDEAQHVFRPMAAGRALPAFITNLEEHRHYGVDFIIVTQHPQLLHASVRALVNPHKHVRRLFGRSTCLVYEWDRCSPVTAYKSATSKRWRHDKKAFSIYKSAELHTKFSQALPLPLIVAVLAVLALPVVGWQVYQRTQQRFGTPASAPAQSGGAPLVSPSAASAPEVPRVPVGPPAFVEAVAPQGTWPVIVAGCWVQAGQCGCITREDRPRIVTDRPALCLSVVNGDLQPPPGLPRPQRAPDQPQQAASAPGEPVPQQASI